MNILELALLLDERSLTATIGQSSEGWVVWLYPADDMTLGIFIGCDSDLSTAINEAIKRWDGVSVS